MRDERGVDSLIACCVGFTIVRRLERLFLTARCIGMTILLTAFVPGSGVMIMRLFALDGV